MNRDEKAQSKAHLKVALAHHLVFAHGWDAREARGFDWMIVQHHFKHPDCKWASLNHNFGAALAVEEAKTAKEKVPR